MMALEKSRRDHSIDTHITRRLRFALSRLSKKTARKVVPRGCVILRFIRYARMCWWCLRHLRYGDGYSLVFRRSCIEGVRRTYHTTLTRHESTPLDFRRLGPNEMLLIVVDRTITHSPHRWICQPVSQSTTPPSPPRHPTVHQQR